MAILAGFAAPGYAYLLTYDLRVADGSKAAEVTNVGDVVTVQLFAVIQNLDGDQTTEGIRQSTGSFMSSYGGLLGNLRGDPDPRDADPVNLVPPFYNAIPYSGGLADDLDGDGDLDVGSTITGTVPAVNPFLSINPGLEFHMGAGPGLTPTEFLLAETTFTVAAGHPGDSTQVWFQPRNRTEGPIILLQTHGFISDGVTYRLKGDDPLMSTSGVEITMIPEPATLGLVAAGLIALVGRRRPR